MGVFNTIIKGMQEALKPISGLVTELASDFKKWLATLTAKDVMQFFSGIKKGVEDFIESFKKGEIGAIVKDTLNIFISLGKIVIGVIQGIATAWMALPQGFRDAARPLVIISLLILQLFGGLLNIVMLLISLNALWASLGIKVALSTALLISAKAILLVIWQAVLVIGAVVAGWTLGSFIG
jgi:phage-related protein